MFLFEQVERDCVSHGMSLQRVSLSSSQTYQPAYSITDDFMPQKPIHTDELSGSTPSPESNPHLWHMDSAYAPTAQTSSRHPSMTRNSVTGSASFFSKRFVFCCKQLLFALDALVLGILSYQLCGEQLPYRLSAWVLIVIFWAHLANKRVRQATLTRLMALLQTLKLYTPRQRSTIPRTPSINMYRDPQLRELYDDTTGYLRALRILHTKDKQ